MSRDVPESDWKIFRELREIALQRFCERVLKELASLIRDDSRGHHDRYSAVLRRLEERDDQLARAFNDPARSRMILQLAAIRAHELLTPDEFARFSADTRGVVESIVKERVR